MESALRDIGVEPTVIASPDTLQGAEPIIHSNCYILKLHGDYKDARILNTDGELSAYPEAYNTLLDRIFDEHGLLVCGWSGEWDNALRAAIERAPNRRYAMFWAARGKLGGRADELCSARKGVVVPISDANSFFGTLVEQVEALARSQRQNPVGVDLLVSRAKRYLAKPEHRIQLADLMSDEVQRIKQRLDQDDMTTHAQRTPEEFERRVAVYESVGEGIAKTCGLVGRWGSPGNVDQAVEAILDLFDHAESKGSGLIAFSILRGYPAVLAFQGLTLGLVKAANWSALRRLFLSEVNAGQPRPEGAFEVISPIKWEGNDKYMWNDYHSACENRREPLSDRLHDVVFGNWATAFMPMNGFTTTFLLSEMMVALMHCERRSVSEFREGLEAAKQNGRDYVWSPVGRACWDRKYQEHVLPKFGNLEFRKELLEAGFLRGDPEYLDIAVESYAKCVDARWW